MFLVVVGCECGKEEGEECQKEKVLGEWQQGGKQPDRHENCGYRLGTLTVEPEVLGLTLGQPLAGQTAWEGLLASAGPSGK